MSLHMEKQTVWDDVINHRFFSAEGLRAALRFVVWVSRLAKITAIKPINNIHKEIPK